MHALTNSKLCWHFNYHNQNTTLSGMSGLLRWVRSCSRKLIGLKMSRAAEEHFNFIRDLPCFNCSAPQRNELSHLSKGTDAGKGIKASPWFTLPLCHTCHAESHRIGEVAFYHGKPDVIKELCTLLYDNTGDKDKAIRLMFRYKRKMMGD